MNYQYYTKKYSNNTESDISLIKGTKTDKLSVLDDDTIKFLSLILHYLYKKSHQTYIDSFNIFNDVKLQRKAIIALKLSNLCEDYHIIRTEDMNNRLINLLNEAKKEGVVVY